MNGLVVIGGWILAAVIALASMYGLIDYPDEPFSKGVSALYASLSRLSWSLALAWVVLACVTGYGGIINSFLSLNIFIPLSRLTFMAYLIHPMVMEAFFMSSQSTYHLQPKFIIIIFAGFLLIVNCMAAAASLFLEAPTLVLQKKLKGRQK